jgi:UDP-2,3-diacylglucosamine pyrophosphatase LpxH
MSEKKIKLVISDFHLSRGKWLKDGRRNPLEDFHQDERFQELLDYYSIGDYENADVELIINGDFFDPLAVIPLPNVHEKLPTLEYPLEVEEPAAVQKIATILDGHPITFDALHVFLKRGKKIIFRWGNHDAVILWPGVQKLLHQRLAPPHPEQLTFQQKPYIFDRICIDHGHQYEIINQFDEEQIFIERQTKYGLKKIQNLPFGSFFVLGFLNRVKLSRSYINQVQPLSLYVRIFALLEPISFISHSLHLFWFFIKMRFITHPMRFARIKKTILIILEALHRPSLEEVSESFFFGPEGEQLPYDTLIMGHNHQATVRIFPGGKQYINTGTWIPITSLDMSNLGHKILRTYALIEYVNGKPQASLKIWHGQPHVTDDFA